MAQLIGVAGWLGDTRQTNMGAGDAICLWLHEHAAMIERSNIAFSSATHSLKRPLVTKGSFNLQPPAWLLEADSQESSQWPGDRTGWASAGRPPKELVTTIHCQSVVHTLAIGEAVAEAAQRQRQQQQEQQERM